MQNNQLQATGVTTAPRLNILALDGGGVRGISSLIILQQLMKEVNDNLQDLCRQRGQKLEGPVGVQDVFRFAVGTSTGGLIAIMLGKLGMSLEDCIKAYDELSSTVFGKKKLRGKMTAGLAKTRYSGKRLKNCIVDLIKRKNFETPFEMYSEPNSDKFGCAVICREHSEESNKYSRLKDGFVFICSIRCPQQIRCCVSEAARATSAAPTYFPLQRIGQRGFVDGGMEYNNPSEAFLNHYIRSALIETSYGTDSKAPKTAHQTHLNFSKVRVINLGTGTKPNEMLTPKRDRLALLIPSTIRMGIFLKQTLTEFATEAEKTAHHMTTLEWASGGGGPVDLEYRRFSADNGVCFIKMDRYERLEEIKQLTRDYLRKQEIADRLSEVARDIANGHIEAIANTGENQRTGFAPDTTRLAPLMGSSSHHSGADSHPSGSIYPSSEISGPSSTRHSVGVVSQDLIDEPISKSPAIVETQYTHSDQGAR